MLEDFRLVGLLLELGQTSTRRLTLLLRIGQMTAKGPETVLAQLQLTEGTDELLFATKPLHADFPGKATTGLDTSPGDCWNTLWPTGFIFDLGNHCETKAATGIPAKH